MNVALVKHSLLSIASTPSEVVKQVLASIESQEVFNSKESLGTLGICRVCIISSIGERQVSHFLRVLGHYRLGLLRSCCVDPVV